MACVIDPGRGEHQLGMPSRAGYSKSRWSWLLRGCTYSTALGNIPTPTASAVRYIRNPWVDKTNAAVGVEADNAAALAAGAMGVLTESFGAVRFAFGGAADGGTYTVQVIRWYLVRGVGEVAVLMPVVAAEATITLGALAYTTASLHTAANVLADTIVETVSHPGVLVLSRADNDTAILEVAAMNCHLIEVRITNSGGTATSMDVLYQLGEPSDSLSMAIENLEANLDTVETKLAELEKIFDGTPTSGNGAADADGNVRDQLTYANGILGNIDTSTAAIGAVADEIHPGQPTSGAAASDPDGSVRDQLAYQNGVGRTIVRYPLRDIAAATTTTIVAAQSGKTIAVHSLLCTLDVAGQVNVHGDAVGDNVCGDLDFGNTGGCAMKWSDNHEFCPQTPVGDALKITNTAGILNGVIIASYAT